MILFCPIFNIGGMNLDHDFVQVSKLSEDQKKGLLQNWSTFPPNSGEDNKKVFTKNGTLFFPNSSGHLRSDAHRNQIIGGDANVDHTQTIAGGGYSQIIGGYIPRGFRHPCQLDCC